MLNTKTGMDKPSYGSEQENEPAAGW